MESLCHSAIANGIYIAVATTTHILLVEATSKRVIPLMRSAPEYYGLSWFPQSEHLILSHSGVDNDQLHDPLALANSEVGYLSHHSFHTPPFLASPHQLLCASDGRVVCTNTGRNSIVAIDLDKPGHFHERRVSSSRWDSAKMGGQGGCHPNSVFEKNGVLYVIAHGHRSGSSLVTMDYPSLEIMEVAPVADRTGLHNIWVTNEGQQLSCHSGIGSVVDLQSNAVIWNAGLPTYLRGLAASADYIVVGESELAGRDVRRSSSGGLWILDRRTYRALDYISLGPYGGVHEVRLLNVPDEAHHGHPFAGWANLLDAGLHDHTTEVKLRAAQAVVEYQQHWDRFSLVFGAPMLLANGFRKQDAAAVSLMLTNPLRAEPADNLCLHYRLDMQAQGSHVAVVQYAGVGADTDMSALLLQPGPNGLATLALWTQDGRTWIRDIEVLADGLPGEGKIQATVADGRLSVAINDKTVFASGNEVLTYAHGKLGIRWSGAEVALAEAV